MHKLFNVFIILFIFCCHRISAQNYPVYNSFFLNPYLYNPAEAAVEHPYLFLNHRQQWSGVEGAPVLSTLNFNTLVNETYTGIGAKITNYSRGILRSTDLTVSYAHGIRFNEKNFMFFGLSGGVITNSIDFNELTPDELADPALANYLANNIQPAASFGMLVRTHGGLNLGITLPQLFSPAFNSPSHFAATNVSPLDNVFVSLYFKRKVDGKLVNKKRRGVHTRVKTDDGYAPLEVYALYKYSALGNNQFEITAKLNLSQNFWLGAGYRQEYGFVAHTGFTVKKFLIGYSFEPGMQPESGFSQGTHEIQLGFRLGKEKHFKRQEPVLRSLMKNAPTEQHLARFQQSTEDPDNINQTGGVAPDVKKYYVVIKAFADFNSADFFKKKLSGDKFNANIYYYPHDRKYYVHVFTTLKASEAYEEARNLKRYTKLQNARVLIVQESGGK